MSESKKNYKMSVLSKTRNGLKRNDLKRARNDLKRPATNKTQSIMIWTYLHWAKRIRETNNNKQIFRLFYNMGQKVLFSSTFSYQHLVAVIQALLFGESRWKQSIKHLLSCVKGQLSCVFFKGHKAYFFSVCVLCQEGKGEAIILAPLFHFHPLHKSFGLQRLYLLERFNDERGLRRQIQEPYYIFLLSKLLLK